MVNEKSPKVRFSSCRYVISVILLAFLMIFSSSGIEENSMASEKSSKVLSANGPLPSNTNILDFEVFSNASQYEIFTENESVVILYSLYYSQPDPYYMVLRSNETILIHQRINTSIFRFSMEVNTSTLGIFNINLDIYSEEVNSLEDLHSNYLIYQDHRIIEIQEVPQSPQIPGIFLEVGKFSTIALISVMGGFLTFFGIRHRLELRQLKQIQTLFQKPSVKSELLSLKKANIILDHLNNRHIFQFCINSYPEIDMNISDYDEHQFWETIVDGGLIL